MSRLIKIPYHISELSCGNKATRMGRQQMIEDNAL